MNRRELTDLCLTFPGVYEDYPFDDDNWCVIRHRGSRKGFAHIYERDGKLCVNLKCDPFEADFLRQAYADVMPAYHMNKVHWNTVIVNGNPSRADNVPEEEPHSMIGKSHALTAPKARRNT